MKWLLLLAAICAASTFAQQHDKIVGCYWGAWSFYRSGDGSFDIDNIDPNLCTHGFYGFADLDNTTWTIKVIDPWYDQAPEDCGPDGAAFCHYDSYRRFVALKDQNPDFIPMISIGGWRAGSGSYSMLAEDPAKRASFVESVVAFCEKYGFEGVDLDWEYPGSREGANPDIDKENFNLLIQEMSDAFKPNNWVFSAAVSASKMTIEIAYDIPFVSSIFDFVNVMSYDYHGWFPNHTFTGHNTPLYGRKDANYEGHPGWYFNVFDSINVWLDGGAPKEKLVMGLASYGRGFILDDPQESGLYCPAYAGIPYGPYTLQDGIWGFQEIMQAFNNDTLINLPEAKPHQWTNVVDDCYKAPYAVNGPYWIGYDTPESIKTKVEYVNFLGLGGAMVWSIDTDDFHGTYHSEKFPILHAIHDTLESGETMDPENPMCTGTAPMCDLFPPTTTEITTTSTTPMTTTSGGLASECDEPNEVMPYPGDCHKYYMCILNANGGYDLQEFTCGDWVFDPNIDACTDPGLDGEDLLCQ